MPAAAAPSPRPRQGEIAPTASYTPSEPDRHRSMHAVARALQLGMKTPEAPQVLSMSSPVREAVLQAQEQEGAASGGTGLRWSEAWVRMSQDLVHGRWPDEPGEPGRGNRGPGNEDSPGVQEMSGEPSELPTQVASQQVAWS